VVLGGLAALNPLIAIVSGLMVLLMVVVVPRPILIVYGLTFMLPLVGGFARGVGIPFLRPGQAALAVGFVLFILTLPSRQGKSRLTAIDLAFALYFLTAAVLPVMALLYQGGHLDLNTPDTFTGATGLQVLLGPIQYYLLYRIVVASISSKRQIKTVLSLSFASSIIVSVIGVLQKLDVGPIRAFLDTYYPSIDLGYTIPDVELRITSTLSNYGGLAAFLSFIIIVALTCYTLQKELKISPLLLVATLLSNSIALVLSGTFVAWIGLAVGGVVVFKLTRRLPKTVIFILVGFALALFIFQSFISDRFTEWVGIAGNQGLFPTYASRIRLWKELFLPIIGQNLVFGAGPSPTVGAYWPSAENEYFNLLLRGGLFHLFSYLLLIGIAIATCWQQIKCKCEATSRAVAIALLAILIAMSVMNLTADYFTYVGGTQVIWTLLAIVVASRQLEALEASAAAKRIVDGSSRTASRPLHSSPSSASTTALAASATDTYRTGEGSSMSSSGLIPHAAVPAVKRFDWDHRRFAWLERLVDWHFVKDSIVVGAGSTMARVLGLLSMTLVARLLAPSDFGFFRYSITLATMITIVSNASPISIARFLAANANDQRARDRYFSNGLVGVALLLTVSLLISVPILWLLHALDLGTMICIVGLTVFYSYVAVVRGLGSAWKLSLNYVLSNVALIIALFVVLGFFKLRTVTAALVIFGLTNAIQILILELIKPAALRFRPNLVSKGVLLGLARFAMPIVVATGTYTIWSGIDMLVIENFNPSAAGSYAAAKTLSGAFIFVPSAISMVLMPRVAALGPDKSKRYCAGAVLVALLVSLIGLVIVALWGNTLIALTFGHRYSDAYFPLLGLSTGMTIYSVYAIVETFIIGRGRPNLSVQAMVVALVSTGVTTFWLASRLGPLGASLAFAIGAALGTAVLLFTTWRFLRNDKQVASSQSSSEDLPTSTTN